MRGRAGTSSQIGSDSALTGPTQATVGQYLGEMRLNYNAPDPNLQLEVGKRYLLKVGSKNRRFAYVTVAS